MPADKGTLGWREVGVSLEALLLGPGTEDGPSTSPKARRGFSEWVLGEGGIHETHSHGEARAAREQKC